MDTTRSHMRRRFIAAVGSAALALAAMTAAAMPARADDRDLARALAAIAAIALIAKAIDNDRDRDHGGYRPPVVHPPHPGPRPHPVPLPAPVYKVLPAACAVDLLDRGRVETWYSRPCLRDRGVTADLPRRCAAEVRLHGRSTTVYRQNCLLNAGFITERGYRPHDHRGRAAQDR